MGLNASSDEWCCQSDDIVRGLPWARKLVDDTLIWASSLPELHSRVETVLSRCQTANIAISKKKLEIGTEIEFAGHIISPGSIQTRSLQVCRNKKFSNSHLHQGFTSIFGTSKPARLIHSQFGTPEEWHGRGWRNTRRLST